MKRFVLCLTVFCLFAGSAIAQDGSLSSSVALSVPTATKIRISSININPHSQVMTVTYQWLDATGAHIYALDGRGSADVTWSCRNDPGQPVANCTAVGVPYACCTGVGTGTGCRAADTSFSDIFGFTIRAQDVGQTLGKGMRALIINKMKAQIPALSGVTISFAD